MSLHKSMESRVSWPEVLCITMNCPSPSQLCGYSSEVSSIFRHLVRGELARSVVQYSGVQSLVRIFSKVESSTELYNIKYLEKKRKVKGQLARSLMQYRVQAPAV